MQYSVQCDWLSHWTLSKGLCMTAIRLHHLLNMCHCPGCHQKATVYTCEWYWFLTGMYGLKLAFCDSQSVLCPKVQVRYCNNTDSWETCRWWSGVSATVGWHAFLVSCVLMSVFPHCANVCLSTNSIATNISTLESCVGVLWQRMGCTACAMCGNTYGVAEPRL